MKHVWRVAPSPDCEGNLGRHLPLVLLNIDILSLSELLGLLCLIWTMQQIPFAFFARTGIGWIDRLLDIICDVALRIRMAYW